MNVEMFANLILVYYRGEIEDNPVIFRASTFSFVSVCIFQGYCNKIQHHTKKLENIAILFQRLGYECSIRENYKIYILFN